MPKVARPIHWIFESKNNIPRQMNINMIKEQKLYGNASTLMCNILQNLKRIHQLILNFET
jgi:hypothetical protein